MVQKPDPKAGSPFPGLSFAGELDDLNEVPLEVTMTDRLEGYMNSRVLDLFRLLVNGKLLHLRFIPDPEAGEVIMVPAESDKEYGAVALNYTPTTNGADISLRLAIKRMRFPIMKGRSYTFPVSTRTSPNGQVYPVLRFAEAENRPIRRPRQRPAAAENAAPAQQG